MLQHHFNAVCDDIWNRLQNSKAFGISQGEETLTDNILLYLASQNISSIKIIQTPKNLEPIKGTDWEWWIGNRKAGYLRYAVQAKKLDFKSGRYSSLNHKVGTGSSSVAQHKILEEYARANKAIPLYAFYNHLEPNDYPKKWNCSLPIDYQKLGCTVTPLKNVKKAISRRGCRTFQKIHEFKETVPVRCLAQCPNIAFAQQDSNDTTYIPKFDMEAKVYSDPWDWISEMGYLSSWKQVQSELYDHELGYYPKRVLLVDTEEHELKK